MEGDVSSGTGTVRAGLGLREALTPARVEETGGGKIEIDLSLGETHHILVTDLEHTPFSLCQYPNFTRCPPAGSVSLCNRLLHFSTRPAPPGLW